MKFEEKLQALRKAKGLTQKECAEHFGMHPSAYNRWESGKNRPDYNNLCRLALFLNTTTDYLLGLDSAPTREHSDILSRLGLTPAAVKVLEDVQQQPEKWRPVSAPLVRALNDIITQNADLEKHLLSLIALYLYSDLDDKTTFCTPAGDPIHTVDLSYRGDDTAVTVLAVETRNIVSSMILDALRDLSQKIQEGENQRISTASRM